MLRGFVAWAIGGGFGGLEQVVARDLGSSELHPEPYLEVRTRSTYNGTQGAYKWVISTVTIGE